MNQKRIKAIIALLLVFILTMGTSLSAFAGKPDGKGKPPNGDDQPLTVTITSLTTFDSDYLVNTEIHFTLKANHKGANESNWIYDDSLQISKVSSDIKKTTITTDFIYTPSVASDSITIEYDSDLSDEETNGQIILPIKVIETSVNKAPVVEEDIASGFVDKIMTINVLENDEDPNGDVLTIVSVNTPNAETDGTVVTFVAASAGSYSFEYTVSDGEFYVIGTVYIDVIDGIFYVALGDSIPYGTYYSSLFDYLTGGTDTTSYVEQFATEFDVINSDYDQSVSGINTIDLFNQLTPGRVGYNASIEDLVVHSDIITLCIGANDIMDAAYRGFGGLEKYNIDWQLADSGRDNFELYFSQVVDRIYELNSDVTLVVMTLFNPYQESELIYNHVDDYFTDDTEGNYGLNYIINNTMSLYGNEYTSDFNYLVADVYTAFNDHSNKNSLTGFYNSFSDPHPNQLGQNLIYNVHLELFNWLY